MLICLVLLIFVGSIATEECKFQTPCKCVLHDDRVIDISSVGLTEYPKFYEIATNKTQCENITELYSYNPCYAFSSSDKRTVVKGDHKACAGAASCIRTPGGDNGELPEEYVIGTQNSALFWISDTHYKINYTAPGTKKTLVVKLHCDENGQNSLKIIEPHCSNASVVTLELSSKCACPNGCKAAPPPPGTPSGLSVGSKLLISFFTILLAYFIVGVLWNFCNGAQGAELVPNLGFWNELPTLILEGVVFSCSCCGRQGTYGEV